MLRSITVFAVSLFLAGSNTFADSIPQCVISVENKEVKTFRVFGPGRLNRPWFVKGKTKSGKERTFRVFAHLLESHQLQLVIADNDKSVSRGSWTAAPTLVESRMTFNDQSDTDLIYGDADDEDPIVKLHCEAKAG